MFPKLFFVGDSYVGTLMSSHVLPLFIIFSVLAGVDSVPFLHNFFCFVALALADEVKYAVTFISLFLVSG